MANPIALSVLPKQTQGGGSLYAIGLTWDPSDPTNRVNGSPNVPTGPIGANYSLLLAAPGSDILAGNGGAAVTDGQVGTAKVYVYDRSLMSILYPGQGIPNIRVNQNDLVWQGSPANIIKPLDTTLYPNFEDLPVNFPNNSLDYPNISREHVTVVADPSGRSRNPLFNSIALNPPLINTGTGYAPITLSNFSQRSQTTELLVPTEFDFNVNVPRYQPANLASSDGKTNNSAGQFVAGGEGFLGRVNVYVDSKNTGVFAPNGGQRDAYRGFNLSLAVAPNNSFQVTTPNIDLGSLSTGTVYVPGTVSQAGLSTPGVQSPWTNSVAKQFTVVNTGNVNLLDLRLAKYNTLSGALQDWSIFSQSNDAFVFLDAGLDVWSSMDATFAPHFGPTNVNPVMLQKPRVADLTPTSLFVTPQARTNPNLPVTNNGFPPGLNASTNLPPTVGVSIPIGMPSGNYAQLMRVVENGADPNFTNQSLTNLSAYSDPGFLMTFSVHEARLTTDAPDTNTTSMVGDLSNHTNFAYSNVQPTATRDANGGLIVAWASDRLPGTPAVSEVRTSQWKIYLAGLGNQTTFQQSTFSTPDGNASTSPLRDLDYFKPASGSSWFTMSASSATGYPNVSTATANGLFDVDTTHGESILKGITSFGSPAFPLNGQVDRLTNSVMPSEYMAFVGEIQKSTPTGLLTDSRIFITAVHSTAGSGVVTADPITTASIVVKDDTTVKGKPTVVQHSNGDAQVFFSGVAANTSHLYYSQYFSGANANSTPINLGSGFQSVDSPSAIARNVNNSAQTPAIELTFTGRLHGQSNSEVFVGRLPIQVANGHHDLIRDANGVPVFSWQVAQSFERLAAKSDLGVYRSKGVVWNVQAGVQLIQQVAGGNPTNLLLNGYGDPDPVTLQWPASGTGSYQASQDTRVVDPQTGIISYDTRLGGKVYFDPTVGTVKFTNGAPLPSADIRLTYTPMFLRVVQSATNTYSSPTGVFDPRIVSDPYDLAGASFPWRVSNTSSGSGDAVVTPGMSGPARTNDRFVFSYNRSASGSGLAARPYQSTMRFGVRLLHPMYVDPTGVPGPVSVVGAALPSTPTLNGKFYQIDPVNGRVYFKAEDEGNLVTVTYVGADPSTGAAITNPTTFTETVQVAPILETDETQIVLDHAVNETGLWMFMDPFSYPNGNDVRPPLEWLFWTSTRNGVPDIYFQTIAPQFVPGPKTAN
jgi:hypothetical protein